jgi:hypothetical protein
MSVHRRNTTSPSLSHSYDEIGVLFKRFVRRYTEIRTRLHRQHLLKLILSAEAHLVDRNFKADMDEQHINEELIPSTLILHPLSKSKI